jgi:quercetin dioxygenase-like cupin family protein
MQERPMTDRTNLAELADLPPFDVWGDAVRARKVEGERITLAVVELAPGAIVPEHRHRQEQLGLCIRGSVRFRIDEEERELGPGGTWRILSNLPHDVVAGPEGAVVIDVFNPTRADWADKLVVDPPTPTKWPEPR